MDNTSYIKEYFNSVADTWPNCSNMLELEQFLSFLPIKENDKVLDLGCGNGIISDILYQKTKNKVIAMDISEKMIKKALEKNNKNIEFINGNFYDYNFSNELFDDIILFNAYPHFIDLKSFIIKVNSLIKKNGYLIICHNLSRLDLEKCHNKNQNNSFIFSRVLLPVEKEYQYYKAYFKKILLKDNDKCFIMVLQKN